MKALIKQFLGKNHSWGVCGWGWADALINLGHEVHLFSTDGVEHLPIHLKNNLIGYTQENQPKVFGRLPDQVYDMQLSFTSMKNFPLYLSSGSKNRFGVWVYEWAGINVLPQGFAKNYHFCDMLCPPSNFGKKIFIDSGVPEQHIKVIPHGINADEYKNTTTIKLSTHKSCKILCNIAQNHIRKNIPGMLEAYGRAFTEKDDVCLILKIKNSTSNSPFEVSIKDCLNAFYLKYPRHAEVKLFTEFINDMSALYRSVDVVFTLSHCEGFFFPGLESIASGKLVIAPNWGGQLDFLNDNNALLVNGQEARANPKSMYWESNPNAIWFNPSIEDAVDKLKYAYQNFEKLNEGIEQQKTIVYNQYDWKIIIQQFLQLCQS